MKNEFKAWDKCKKEYANFMININGVYFWEKSTGCWLGKDTKDFKNYILLQYTGILDKDGQQIYEGDYLMNTQTKETYKVIWNGSYAAFEMISIKDKRKSLFGANQSFGRFKVVGNIYEGRK